MNLITKVLLLLCLPTVGLADDEVNWEDPNLSHRSSEVADAAMSCEREASDKRLMENCLKKVGLRSLAEINQAIGMMRAAPSGVSTLADRVADDDRPAAPGTASGVEMEKSAAPVAEGRESKP